MHLVRFLVLVVLGSGCARPASSPGLDPPASRSSGLRYAFDVRDEIRTEVLGPDGTPVEVPGLAAEVLAWEGDLHLEYRRAFPDDSLGWLVQFGSVQATVDGLHGESSGDLGGLSMELRSFRSREILAVDLLDHLSGAPRHGDLLVPLLLALSPAVPEIPVGASAPRRVHLPILPEVGRGVRTAWDLTWSRLEDAPIADGGRCIVFHWNGPVEGEGGDGGPGWAARYRISGTATGDTCLGTQDYQVVSGSIQWTGTVIAALGARTSDGSYAKRGTLRQHHDWQGRLTRMGGRP
ncbi:MAG: hypothetical protein JXB39_10020 [Deltaproteobacteria bacterium]|nr:hypothetical protein [Deltaproteobacteria bacterium]